MKSQVLAAALSVAAALQGQAPATICARSPWSGQLSLARAHCSPIRNWRPAPKGSRSEDKADEAKGK